MAQATKEKVDNRYIFPNFLADAMSKADFRTQNEASLLSQTLLILGMILMVVYMAMYGGQSLYFKILLIFNLLCGMVFMGSYLVTTYQQYKSYMDTMGISADAEKKKIKASGNIFKRISQAWKNRKQNKLNAEAAAKVTKIMEKSGIAKEVSPEEKAIDDEIEDIVNDRTNLKGGQD